jgi:hypothetical protein
MKVNANPTSADISGIIEFGDNGVQQKLYLANAFNGRTGFTFVSDEAGAGAAMVYELWNEPEPVGCTIQQFVAAVNAAHDVV